MCEKLKCGNDVTLCDYSGQMEHDMLCASNDFIEKQIINLLIINLWFSQFDDIQGDRKCFKNVCIRRSGDRASW